MTPRIPSWGPIFKATFSVSDRLDISGLKSEVEKGLAFIELGHPTRDHSDSDTEFMQRYVTCSQVRAVARITDIHLSDRDVSETTEGECRPCCVRVLVAMLGRESIPVILRTCAHSLA